MKSYIYYKNTDIDSGIREWLDSMNDFREGYIYEQKISRTQKWYHTELKKFSSTWKKEYDRWEPFPYCRELYNYQAFVQKEVNAICDTLGIHRPIFNSCLINKYEDGDKLIKPHSDHQTTFGEKPVVAILSIGDTRRLHFRPISYLQTKKKTNKDFYYDLEHNSLLVMAGDTQKEYCHSIDKENNKDLRYSLTFREHN